MKKIIFLLILFFLSTCSFVLAEEIVDGVVVSEGNITTSGGTVSVENFLMGRLELTTDTVITEKQLLGAKYITNQGSSGEVDLIAWGNSGDDLIKVSGGDDVAPTADYNCADFTSNVSNWPNEVHKIDSNPYFLDPENGNLNLQNKSPCINFGTDPLSDGDGDQHDLKNRLIWSDNSDSPVGPWADGVDIGCFGDNTGPAIMMGF